MTRKAFNVYLYYHGCISDIIIAENKEQATEMLRRHINTLNIEEFTEKAGIMEEGCDIYEIGEEINSETTC